ncbi:hypothetical protein BGZ99_008250 [Dissophora globulifera]|uniref:SET domain-containing protein n=1 Tax=Dissophora globulifera TaxID=979702 RepID=A0A9P6RVF7_9FUNG|nr:hypothetical protein BGZ99_008250 [Dissophora globulifera]
MSPSTIEVASSPSELPGYSVSSDLAQFPVKVMLLPNRGRSYIATRTIGPQELIFVAEPYGTTVCDPWLNSGVCHYCWTTTQDRTTQVRLPKADKKGGRTPDTVMVFCDNTCLQRFGPDIAEAICKVEHNVRRTWSHHGAHLWRYETTLTPKSSTNAAATDPLAGTVRTAHGSTPYSALVLQAMSIAATQEALLKLSDQDLSNFLNCVWDALDGLVEQQESHIKAQTASVESSVAQQQNTRKQCQELYPKLASHLLKGNNNATVASRISDDDCEIARLITEVIYRRQLDPRETSRDDLCASTEPSAASIIQNERVNFADYRAMQSNELVLLRQQLLLDMTEQDPVHGRDQITKDFLEAAESHSQFMVQWRQLLSILPTHLLGCFYLYLRLRDAYLLQFVEEAFLDSPSRSLAAPAIDNTLFRTILFGEVANSFGIRDSSDELLGFAVFPRACFFNHSCRPNVEKRRRQGNKAREMEYWSTRVIEAGEECCISYGDISKGRVERQQRLEDMYFFQCSCVRCLEDEAIGQE